MIWGFMIWGAVCIELGHIFLEFKAFMTVSHNSFGGGFEPVTFP